MKKTLCVCAALSLVLLGGCAPAESNAAPDASASTPVSSAPVSQPTAPAESETPSVSAPDPNAGPTTLDYASEVTAMEGEWTLSEVYAADATAAASEGAMSLKVSLELDPSELVDEAAYIHNQVYNMTGYLTFGLDSITQTLAADEVEEYKGSAGWQNFPQGEVVEDGAFYKQPGPATMRFKDVDDYGLFLDQIAGVSADIDTTEKTLIIGLNANGQLLLGYSDEHLEVPGTEGEWVYCLIFDKAA